MEHVPELVSLLRDDGPVAGLGRNGSSNVPATLGIDWQDYLNYCWTRGASGGCKQCLYIADEKWPCGWCPQSQVCIPATSIFNPISGNLTCPGKGERFDLRIRPFGCGLSCLTVYSMSGAIMGTLVLLGILLATLLCCRRASENRHKRAPHRGSRRPKPQCPPKPQLPQQAWWGDDNSNGSERTALLDGGDEGSDDYGSDGRQRQPPYMWWPERGSKSSPGLAQKEERSQGDGQEDMPGAYSHDRYVGNADAHSTDDEGRSQSYKSDKSRCGRVGSGRSLASRRSKGKGKGKVVGSLRSMRDSQRAMGDTEASRSRRSRKSAEWVYR